MLPLFLLIDKKPTQIQAYKILLYFPNPNQTIKYSPTTTRVFDFSI